MLYHINTSWKGKITTYLLKGWIPYLSRVSRPSFNSHRRSVWQFWQFPPLPADPYISFCLLFWGTSNPVEQIFSAFGRLQKEKPFVLWAELHPQLDSVGVCAVLSIGIDLWYVLQIKEVICTCLTLITFHSVHLHLQILLPFSSFPFLFYP